MTQTKLFKFKKYPIDFLFREFFKFEVNYMHPIELPIFPKELQVDTSALHKGLQKISDFAVSKYLIQDLTSIMPKNIWKSLALSTKKILTVILQARSNYLSKND